MTNNQNKTSFKQIILRLSLIGLVFIAGLAVYSDAEIQKKFASNRWLVPAKVYTRAKSLMEGSYLPVKDFVWELELLNYRKVIKATRPGEYERYGNDFILYLREFKFSDHAEPARKVSLTITNNHIVNCRLISGDKAVNPLRLEPVFIDSINPLVHEDRELVKIDQVPPALVDALLVSEDRQFFEHHGVSIKGIFRALGKNISEGEISQGGSTLTQQLVKNYFLSNERTLWRKIREAIMAIILELRYSKDEILQAYINEVYLGQNGAQAIHGFAKASRFYFDQSISDLNLSQVATLVALVRGPSYYDPRRYPERIKTRRNLILKQLLSFNRITEQQWQRAQQKSLQVIPRNRPVRSNMPAVISMVKRQLRQDYTVEQLDHDGLSVFTTIDPLAQYRAEQSVESRVDWLTKNYPSVPQELQAALVASDRFTGEVIAVVGDRKPSYAGFNRAIDAYRQTGSAIKPFVYLTALEQASRYSLISEIEDRRFSLTATDGSLWKPENYDKQEHGRVTLEQAMVNSYNLSTARLAINLGVETIVDKLYEFGFRRQLRAFPSLALGAQEMSPWELLKLYQVLATGGLKVESSVIASVIDAEGKLLDRYPLTAEQVSPPESIYLIDTLLQQVAKEGTAKQLQYRLPGLAVAGKTGTTDELKDSWFAGFSENYLTVVWLGMDNNQTTHLTGASGAMQVWADYIDAVEYQPLILHPPQGIVLAESGWFSSCIPFVSGYVPDDYELCSND